MDRVLSRLSRDLGDPCVSGPRRTAFYRHGEAARELGHDKDAPPGAPLWERQPMLSPGSIRNSPTETSRSAMPSQPAQTAKLLTFCICIETIELFHKILKSECRAEETKLRAAERLVNLLSIYCTLSWRTFWMTMLNRVVPNVPPHLALTGLEIDLLDELVTDKDPVALRRRTLVLLLNQDRPHGWLSRPWP